MFNFQLIVKHPICHLPSSIFLFFLFLSIGAYSQNQSSPTDSLPDCPFLHKTMTDFPWYIVRTGKGKLENVLGGKLPKPADTIALKKVVTSLVIRHDSLPDGVFMDSTYSIYTTCHLIRDTLYLEFQYDQLPHEAILRIAVTDKVKASIRYSLPENPKEKMQVPPVALNSLALDKKKYKKEDYLKGHLTFTIDYELSDVRRGQYHQKVFYEGWVSCAVE